MAAPRSDSDWLGGRVFLPLIFGFLAGTLLSVSLATVSAFKAERGAGWAWVLAMPALLLLVAAGSWYLSTHQRERASHEAMAAQSAYLQEIVKNPGIVLTQRWAETGDARLGALMMSFSVGAVPYTDEQMRRLYDEAPNMRNYLFKHHACSAQFIREHFDEAFKLAHGINTTMLDSMQENPNFPQDLRERLRSAQ